MGKTYKKTQKANKPCMQKKDTAKESQKDTCCETTETPQN